MQNEIMIRELRADDDFGLIHKWIKRSNRQPYYGGSPESVKQIWFSDSPEPNRQRKGLLAETNQGPLAFVGLEIRGVNGVIAYGYDDEKLSSEFAVEVMLKLVERCEAEVRALGGDRLFSFVYTQFGQLHNRQISLFERVGFKTHDEHYRVSFRLLLQEWQPSFDPVEPGRIQAGKLELEQVRKLLIEDGNGPNAVIFSHQYRAKHPGHVILSLHDAHDQIQAVAYYKVRQMHAPEGDLSALAFHIHFRPEFKLSSIEKKRFLESVLHSMKQLDVVEVHALLSLNQPDTFLMLVREGFDELDSCFFAMEKRIGARV